jgi:hypothetical protein
MDWKTLASNTVWALSTLLSSWAWPIALLLCVLAFHGSIARILKRVAEHPFKATVGGVALEFAEIMAEVTRSPIRDALAPAAFRAAGLDVVSQQIHQVAQVSPRAAILDAFAHLESALRQAAGRRPEPGRPASVLPLYALLERVKGKPLMGAELLVIDKLARLRNSIAHSTETPLSAALVHEYIDTCLTIADKLLMDGMDNRLLEGSDA